MVEGTILWIIFYLIVKADMNHMDYLAEKKRKEIEQSKKMKVKRDAEIAKRKKSKEELMNELKDLKSELFYKERIKNMKEISEKSKKS